VRLAIVLLLTCGCRQIFGIDQPRLLDGGLPPDDSIDASADASHLCFSRPDLSFGACLSQVPTTAYSVPTSVAFDTDTNLGQCEATLIAPSQDMCVVAATDITVSAAVTVTGSRPLVLFATGAILIDAAFDVASHGVGPMRGPGDDPSVCGTAGGGTISGGGAGGSFTTSGADGGRGGENNAFGGTAVPAFPAQTFHGGCRGGLGGGGMAGVAYGGGALALVSKNQVVITGAIDASGAGGDGAVIGGHGGYGGGTGGMVLIDAPSFILQGSAEIYANGGAGGGGSSLSEIGIPGDEAASYNGAIHGGQGGNGGNGGDALPQLQPGQQAAGQNAGGGGGGGGAGAIIIYTNTGVGSFPKISPQAIVHAY
jgi:hypothetical protein